MSLILILMFYTLSLLFLLRRKIDSFFIAFLGMFVYYFPIFTGLLMNLNSEAKSVGLSNNVSLDLQLSIVFILTFLFVFSCCNLKIKSRYKVFYLNDKQVVFVTLAFCLLLSLYLIPVALQHTGKSARASSVGALHVVFEYSFAIGIAFSLYQFIECWKKNKKIKSYTNLIVFLFLVFVAVLIFQTRSVAFFSFLAVLVFYIYNKKIALHLFGWKIIVIAPFIFIVFIGKHVAGYIFYGAVYDDYFLVVSSSFESFYISSFLNHVYNSELTVNTFKYIIYNLTPGFSNEVVNYHEAIKDNLFPNVSYGMGGNPIGEAWLNFKWLGIVIYSLLLCFKCYFFNFFVERSQGALKVFLCVLMLFSLFYVNRNSIQTDLIFVRNYLLIMSTFVLIASIFFSKSLIRYIRE